MSTLQDLLARKAALEQEIESTQKRERSDAIAKVKALMTEYGLTAADLTAKGGSRAGAADDGVDLPDGGCGERLADVRDAPRRRAVVLAIDTMLDGGMPTAALPTPT